MIEPLGASFLGLLVLSYLAGSVPFGLIAARIKGVDLRGTGSGNIGATNVLRAAGKWPALFTLGGDFLKGALVVALGRALGLRDLQQGLMGLFAILGHDFSIFLRFKGGKGVATSLGVIAVYVPLAGLITSALWLLTAWVTRYSSLAALVSFAALAPVVLLLKKNTYMGALALSITLLLIYKHLDNIKRLKEGTERRIGEKQQV